MSFFLGLFVVCLFYLCYLGLRHPKGFPQHPNWSIPLIGDFLLFRKGFALGLTKLRAKYGDVFGFLLGGRRVLILCDYGLIQEVGKMEEINGRLVRSSMAKIRGSQSSHEDYIMPGVVMSQGKTWKEQRNFAMLALKRFGREKQFNEKGIAQDMNWLCSSLSSEKGTPLYIGPKISIIAFTSIWNLCTEENLKPDNTDVVDLMSLLQNHLLELQEPISQFFAYQPFLESLAMKIKFREVGKNFKQTLIAFIEKSIITVREKHAINKSSDESLVVKYLQYIKRQETVKTELSFCGELGLINLKSVLMDLFGAGVETTTGAINWAFHFMVLNPEIQDRVQQELDEKVGKGVQPLLTDRRQTPYTEAVLHEAQRMGSVAHLTVAHRATKDCHLSTGHYVPRNTMVIFWLGAVMKDPKEFPDPEKFDPNRYLNSNGIFVPNSKVMAFGSGKRRCPGEKLALAFIYMVFTGVLSKFRLEKAQENDYISTVPIDGFTRSPIPYNFKFVPRL